MSIDNYLKHLANHAIVRDSERESIKRSVSTLRWRLKQHFGSEITAQLIFGSYSRGTILPRRMDPASDVDYMVVFRDSSFRPQTYLDRLRRFTETRYSKSEISQSHPTIILSLEHIRFELVPAIEDWFQGYRIPKKDGDYDTWIRTDPKALNDSLTQANKDNNNLIKPLVRVLKYWNTANGAPFSSYELEQDIVGHPFWLGLLSHNRSLAEHLVGYIGAMSVGFFAPHSKHHAVSRAKRLVKEVKSTRRANPQKARDILQQLIPPPAGLKV